MDSDAGLAALAFALAFLIFIGVTAAQGAFLCLGEGASLPWSERVIVARPARRLLSRYSRVSHIFPLLRIGATLALGIAVVAWAAGAGLRSWALLVLPTALVLAILSFSLGLARTVGRRYPYWVLLLTAPFLAVLDWLLSPFLRLLERVQGLGSWWEAQGHHGAAPAAAGPRRGVPALSPEEEDFQADPEERRMIQGILRLEEINARDVMIPRVDILAVDVDSPLQEVAALMASKHTRMPVYQGSIDHVLGFVHARDLVGALSSQEKVPLLKDILRPAVFIPDSKPLDQLLVQFRDQRVTIAVVVDEYGGTEGLISLEDVLEEIVGDIQDEFERGEPKVIRVSEHEAIVDGRVTLEVLNQIFGTALEGDGYDTVAGLLSTHLGKIPAQGDALSVGDLRMRVLAATGRRVLKVRVRTPSSP